MALPGSTVQMSYAGAAAEHDALSGPDNPATLLNARVSSKKSRESILRCLNPCLRERASLFVRRTTPWGKPPLNKTSAKFDMHLGRCCWCYRLL
jgi:hypothetical protein